MTTAPSRIVVAIDANVLINLLHVSRLGMCALIPGHVFVVPEHVREEVRDPAQRALLDGAVASGMLRVEAITDLGTLALFADLTMFIGRGEGACLAMAAANGWSVASDERRRFRREVEKRIGLTRLLGTADLFLLAIRAGLLTVAEADADKELLAQRRFRMPFKSFADALGGA